jgi:hypothetical protein
MTRLPDGYREIRRIDLIRNHAQALRVNLLALLIMCGMAGLGFALCPPFEEQHIGVHTVIGIALTLFGVLIYIVLHEVVHGVFMKAFSGRKPHYGYTGFYAYAGSDALFGRTQYLIIAFAPVVILGAVLAVLTRAFYETAFWYLYCIQIVNISGAAGDLYVGYFIARSDRDVMVRDKGTDMSLYSAQ